MARKKTVASPSAASNIPKPTRPIMPSGYSQQGANSDFLPWTWVTQRLERSRNYWVCTVCPDGRPHSMPVWGVYVDAAFVFSTDPSALKARNMQHNPAITIHLESGDEVVILNGKVEVISVNKTVDDAYYAKYKLRLSTFPGPAAIYRLKPNVVLAWREKDFPTSATRWKFE